MNKKINFIKDFSDFNKYIQSQKDDIKVNATVYTKKVNYLEMFDSNKNMKYVNMKYFIIPWITKYNFEIDNGRIYFSLIAEENEDKNSNFKYFLADIYEFTNENNVLNFRIHNDDYTQRKKSKNTKWIKNT